MPKHPLDIPAILLTVDSQAPAPIYRQLYERLRDAILSGRLAPGARLPSTRALAEALGVARSTAASAYDQLLAEGYVEGRIGSGTYISRALPDELLRVRAGAASPLPSARPRGLSRRGAALATTPVSAASYPSLGRAFQPGIPALDIFPFETWARLTTRCLRKPSAGLMAYGDPAGYRPLRNAIAAYLRDSRGVRCGGEQIIITTGSQQGLDLAARLLLDPDDSVWVEDPGYLGARGALRSAGARLVGVPVDDEGLDVAAGAAVCPHARMAYVTPSHQYPLGVTMSLSRRLALLEWARGVGAWLLEDDYDSEYRYSSRPLPSLQGLDDDGRTIYVGTFSKVLFPGLRLGYLVVPADLVAAFVAARALVDRHPHAIDQAVLTEFIEEGHFVRHIRRTRVLYAERQAALVAAAGRHLRGIVEVAPVESGMHLIGWLPVGSDDRAASSQAAAAGVDAPALSRFRLSAQPAQRPGLLLGYAAFEAAAMQEGALKLADALRKAVRP